MKILLLVNPFSSSVTRRSQVLIGKTLSADHEVTVSETRRRDHATRLAQGAAVDGTDLVVVLGGDGTLNEAANGLAGSATALAPLPGGSTNVFSRTIGMPDDPIDASLTLLEALEAGRLHRRGMGKVNGRYFLFHTGVGFDAAVVEQVERRAQWKRWGGHAWFIAATVDTFFRHFDRDAMTFTVEHTEVGAEPGRPDPSPATGVMTVVLNSSPYTYLGPRPLDVAPDATLDRPLVAITMEKASAASLVKAAAASLSGERGLGGIKGISYRPNLASVTVTGTSPLPHQVDGDHLGETDTLRFSHEPNSITLVLPHVPAPDVAT